MLFEIVDEHGHRRSMFGSEPCDRLSLPALIAHDPVADTKRIQLRGATGVAPVLKIGEDDDVRHRGDPLQRLGRARHQSLSIHFGAEKSVEQRPDLFGRHLLARSAPRERGFERATQRHEVDIVRLVEPLAEVPHHMQQHLVTIGDEQRTAHDSNVFRASTKATGCTSSASAQAIKSAS